jgi:hypothetical protein
MHALSDANGLPLLVGVSAGNTHGTEGLKQMVGGAPNETRPPPRPVRSSLSACMRTRPATVPVRRWLLRKHIGVRIARNSIEANERSGRRRLVIERTM